MRVWRIVHPEDGTTAAAWEVRPEGEDETSVWSVKCVVEALEAGRQLHLVQPIIEGDTGAWAWEQYKKNGCEHCKHWRRLAVSLRLVPTAGEYYAIEDGKHHRLVGVQPYALTDFPLQPPAHWDTLDLVTATAFRLAIQSGVVNPIFR